MYQHSTKIRHLPFSIYLGRTEHQDINPFHQKPSTPSTSSHTISFDPSRDFDHVHIKHTSVNLTFFHTQRERGVRNLRSYLREIVDLAISKV
jgi:hypothetical protein